MDFFKNMSTNKLIAIVVVVAIGLNILAESSKKSFDKAVLSAIANNNTLAQQALAGNLPAEFNVNGKQIAKNPEPAPEPQPAAPPAEPDPEEQFKQQLADKVTVDIGTTPVLGNNNAQIMLIVFSDFQCPFSKRGADTAMALIAKYGDKINFVHKNLPLGFHQEALPSAKAALAAGKQGKFYEYHDKLYEGQESLGEDLYVQIAKDLGLNLDKFNTDRGSDEIAQQIKDDENQASKLGFRGTPGFTLNGVKVLGAYPQDHFEKIINALNLG